MGTKSEDKEQRMELTFRMWYCRILELTKYGAQAGQVSRRKNIKVSDLIKVRKLCVGYSVPPEALLYFLLMEN